MSIFFLELENKGGLCYSRLSAAVKTLRIFIGVIKQTLRYSNVFFYNRTPAYAALPQFGTLF
jgi:hypothetical protein